MGLEWRIYYGDGTLYDSSMGEPECAPPFDILVIVGYDEEGGRMLLHKWNYYWCKDVEGRAIWYGSDFMGLVDQLAHDETRSIHGVKMGRTVPNAVYRQALSDAGRDEDFPKNNRKPFLDKPTDVM